MSKPEDKRSIVERLAERLELEGGQSHPLLPHSFLQATPIGNQHHQPLPGQQPVIPPAPEVPPRNRTTSPIDVAHLQRAGMVVPTGGRSRILDEYRLIKRPILHNATGKNSVEHRRNLVMVTSARSGEGKTFTSISLAMSVVAEQATQVLLVDLDLTKQQLCKRLGIRTGKGTLDLLRHKETDLSEVIVDTNIPRLSVLPAGADDPLAHELLAGPEMDHLMDEIAERYRGGLVIIDTAPILLTTDSSVIASKVGQVILVVEANETGRTSVEESISLVQQCDQVSLVLNRVAADELTEQYGAYYAT